MGDGLPGLRFNDQTKAARWHHVVEALEAVRDRDGGAFPAADVIARELRDRGFQCAEGFRLGAATDELQTADGNVRADLMLGNVAVLRAPAESIQRIRAWVGIARSNPHVKDVVVVTGLARQAKARQVDAHLQWWR